MSIYSSVHGVAPQNSGTHEAPHRGLRQAGFDRWFIFGIPVVALASLLVVLIWPGAFYTVLVLDLWLLGYHHVIATYTRIGLDRESRAKYWALLVLLPIGVIGAVFAIGLAAGAAFLTTIYFYWLWFHYIRQSEGVSKAYAARGGMRDAADVLLHRISFYLVPTASLLQLMHAGNGFLLGIKIYAPAIPAGAMASVWVVTALVALLSLFRIYMLTRERKASRFYLAFVCTHYLMFVVTYGLIKDVSVAWLGLNIWHNLQYLTFVWLSHERRFKGKVSDEAKLLSTLALPRNVWMYVLGCLAVTFAFYMGVQEILSPIEATLGTSGVLTAVMVYQTINFHHYIVDAIIWRRPKSETAAFSSAASSAE